MIKTIKASKLCLICCALLFAGASTLAYAQSEAPVEEPVTTSNSLLTKVKQGGWAMYPLGVLSMSAFALTVYNFIALRKKDFFDDEVATQLGDKLNSLDIEGATSLSLHRSAFAADADRQPWPRLH